MTICRTVSDGDVLVIGEVIIRVNVHRASRFKLLIDTPPETEVSHQKGRAEPAFDPNSPLRQV
jgi:hypothetical protein